MRKYVIDPNSELSASVHSFDKLWDGLVADEAFEVHAIDITEVPISECTAENFAKVFMTHGIKYFDISWCKDIDVDGKEGVFYAEHFWVEESDELDHLYKVTQAIFNIEDFNDTVEQVLGSSFKPEEVINLILDTMSKYTDTHDTYYCNIWIE